MSYPNRAVWSHTVYPTGAEFTFSDDRLTAICAGPDQAICRTNVPLTSGVYCFAVQFDQASGYLDAGCFTSSSIVTGGESYPAVGIVVGDTGTIQYSAGGGSYGTVGTIGAPSAGQYWVWFIDTGSGTGSSGTAQFWVGLVDPTSSLQGNWNGVSGANPLTGVGGIACAAMTDFVPACWFYSGNGEVVLVSEASALPGGISAGSFQSLPFTTDDEILQIISVSGVAGGAMVVDWACSGGNSGAIKYSIDGGDYLTPTSGTTSGASGSFTFPAPNDSSTHSLVIQDSTNTLDTSAELMFVGGPPGNQIGYVYLNPAPMGGTEGPWVFSSASSTINFVVAYSYLSGGSGDGAGGTIHFLDANGTPMFLIDLLIQGGGASYVGKVLSEFDGGDAPDISDTGGDFWVNGSASFTQTGANVTGSLAFTSSSGAIFSESDFVFQNNAGEGGGTVAAVDLVAYSTTDVHCVLIIEVTTPTAPVGPDAPEDLAAHQYIGSSVALTWAAYTDSSATALDVFRGTGLNTAFDDCASIGTVPTSDVSYIDDGTSYNGAYTYYLVADGSDADSDPSNAATVSTPQAVVVPAWNGRPR